MKYLDNSTVTVDAILTKKGREILSQPGGDFQIVKFAVGDDEVDYDLYDTANNNGTSYYGQAIENMSVVEANPNETKTMRYKLISLPINSQRVPGIAMDGGITSYTIESDLAPPGLSLTPVTTNPANSNTTLGYTATVSDGSILKVEGVGTNAGGGTSVSNMQGIQTNIANKTVTATGTSFNIMPVPQYNENKSATVMISGNETGGYVTVTITVNKQTVSYSATGE
jgi:hypothetical protein